MGPKTSYPFLRPHDLFNNLKERCAAIFALFRSRQRIVNAPILIKGGNFRSFRWDSSCFIKPLKSQFCANSTPSYSFPYPVQKNKSSNIRSSPPVAAYQSWRKSYVGRPIFSLSPSPKGDGRRAKKIEASPDLPSFGSGAVKPLIPGALFVCRLF